ncbi:Hypothetical protein SMAX5B_002922 [Scophthalmus maximus]|uniref:Uncharacterized protein n=1 Tax=Scophthalmus maximus TaxID=52904 RepID=A0A2U9BDP8_SCOMX|nr:Hypothetical protein SMAX5B_002922 [Scophthalmus maximus]
MGRLSLRLNRGLWASQWTDLTVPLKVRPAPKIESRLRLGHLSSLRSQQWTHGDGVVVEDKGVGEGRKPILRRARGLGTASSCDGCEEKKTVERGRFSGQESGSGGGGRKNTEERGRFSGQKWAVGEEEGQMQTDEGDSQVTKSGGGGGGRNE